MMSTADRTILEKQIQWTPRLIRRLRGKRTQDEFAALVGATMNTVWRWEDGRSQPDEGHARRLSELAESERFLKDWRLAGSGALSGDIDASLRRSAAGARQTLARRAKALEE
jgi:transcriptional regulator with XRE-family HTH domain